MYLKSRIQGGTPYALWMEAPDEDFIAVSDMDKTRLEQFAKSVRGMIDPAEKSSNKSLAETAINKLITGNYSLETKALYKWFVRTKNGAIGFKDGASTGGSSGISIGKGYSNWVDVLAHEVVHTFAYTYSTLNGKQNTWYSADQAFIEFQPFINSYRCGRIDLKNYIVTDTTYNYSKKMGLQ